MVLAGAEYGTGSSRDWAAKGTFLLGVRAVLAVSFERIHRSNLVGMGILPLELPPGKSWAVARTDRRGESSKFPTSTTSSSRSRRSRVRATRPTAA